MKCPPLCYSLPVTGKDALAILSIGFVHSVKDPLWGNIPMTAGMKALLDTDEVEKLSRIKQNGPAFHIYPGAVHTRLSHSLGVYCLGREILLTLSRKKAELPFTETGIRSFLAACLLHDIGHFPYAHSLKELSMRKHEEIAGSLILTSPGLRSAVKNAGADPEMTAAIIDTDAASASAETDFYRSMLSGTLDPDKLDYLSRDAFFAGIPYGTQDTGFIISSLNLEDGCLALEYDAISLVEQVLFSKYMMYRNLYWHKGVRGATCMIKKAVLSALRDELISFDDLYLKDDGEFTALCSRFPDYGPFSLIWNVEHGHLLERKAVKDYDGEGILEKKTSDLETRWMAEEQIFAHLSPLYPDLRSYEVIIDIPEPVSFESAIPVLLPSGELTTADDAGMIFQKAGSLFSSSLRKMALYLPQYVKKEDAEEAFREVQRG